jgi:hypothetical protein
MVSPLNVGDTISANVSLFGGSAYVVKGGASPNAAGVTSLSAVWIGKS